MKNTDQVRRQIYWTSSAILCELHPSKPIDFKGAFKL